MHQGLLPFIVRRAGSAVLLVLVVSSAALWLMAAAPGDHFTEIDMPAEVAAAERARLGLDRPFVVQYGVWLGRVLLLDLGESLKYRRPVEDLVGERAANTAVLGIAALVLATIVGIPAGVWTGSTGGAAAALVRGVSVVMVSIPPLVTSFLLLLFASSTRWLPVGGIGALSGRNGDAADLARYLLLPCLALALPIAAILERLQSQAMRQALGDPSVQAARARGIPGPRLVWRHAFRLSLKPVVALYGVLVGSVLSGSFVVELVMSWPGLGALTYEALVGRDLYLVAGCAAAGSVFLALGVLASDIALAIVDPRLTEQT